MLIASDVGVSTAGISNNDRGFITPPIRSLMRSMVSTLAPQLAEIGRRIP